VPGAIVIAEAESRIEESEGPNSQGFSSRERRRHFLAGVELLGQSVFGRLVQHLSHFSFDTTSVFVDSSLALEIDDLSGMQVDVTDVWRGAARSLIEAKEAGVDAVLLVLAGAYVEFDPVDLIRFHRDCGNIVTRACDERGFLDLWVADPGMVRDNIDLKGSLQTAGEPYYQVSGYVNRMETLRDMRQLVADGLSSRCRLRPQGIEVRPGMWMAEGAEVERGARIVAPAFLGRDVKISEQCLITRCSSIERNCQIDYGTVVEDSSILSGTYVGIGLDLSHCIADGTCLVNLNREVALEIKDPVVMRQVRPNKPRGEGNRQLPSNFRHGEAVLSAGDER
jgi:carbonic anhydrase/acetyltransferase-like protein (isoleucine patch superfamily)